MVIPKAERAALTEEIKFRVDLPMLRRLEAICDETGRKLSDVLRLMIDDGLDAHEAAKKPKR
jgi:predicted DNA-binding protein